MSLKLFSLPRDQGKAKSVGSKLCAPCPLNVTHIPFFLLLFLSLDFYFLSSQGLPGPKGERGEKVGFSGAGQHHDCILPSEECEWEPAVQAADPTFVCTYSLVPSQCLHRLCRGDGVHPAAVRSSLASLVGMKKRQLKSLGGGETVTLLASRSCCFLRGCMRRDSFEITLWHAPAGDPCCL